MASHAFVRLQTGQVVAIEQANLLIIVNHDSGGRWIVLDQVPCEKWLLAGHCVLCASCGVEKGLGMLLHHS